VCRRQQFAERFAAHDVGSAGRVEPIGRIRLTALELKDRKLSRVPLNIPVHPAIEAGLINTMALFDRLGARVFLVLLYALRHVPLPRLGKWRVGVFA
jgi:hypothetical protein